ncbi:MAG: RNA polymerase sigma factor [Pirellulaceae bacterium]
MHDIPNTRSSLLVRLRKPHDEQAWAEFIEIYEPLVYQLARQRGLQDADARELCQEVFVAVSSAIERWQPDPARAKFRTWLFRIARNLIVHALVVRRRHPQGTGDSDFYALLEQQPAPDSEEATEFDQEYRQQLLRWAADRVRGQFHSTTWEAFWLTSVEGQEVRQVAARLGMSVGAVYIARSRVMARLRETIEKFEGKQE